MRLPLFFFFFLTFELLIGQSPVTDGAAWSVSNITANNELEYPNEITYGPDNYLWITERVGKKVVKVDPDGGSKIVMLDLGTTVYQADTQDGLMGFAIHPDLYTDLNTPNNYIYLAYTYNDGDRKLRIASYRYNATTGLLDSTATTVLLEDIIASDDHNSGRLKMGPDLKLYYSIGDLGANQGDNVCNEIKSQVLPASPTDYDNYQGKILRINLDGGIPNDNPILNGVRSHVFSFGHRNAQGLVFSKSGVLYSSEHGPKVDDELNIIEAGKNYGWPQIAGYFDNNAYSYCNWSSSAAGCDMSAYDVNSCPSDVIPIDEFTAGIPSNFQEPIGTFNSTTSTIPTGGYFEWPTVAPAGMTLYEAGLIPEWNNSLLIATLKRGIIYRTKLNSGGTGLEDGNYEIFHSSNDRYRDLALDPDGVTLYAITDNAGGTSGPSGNSNVTIDNPGLIVKIEYQGTLTTPEFMSNNQFFLGPNPARNMVNLRFNEHSIQAAQIELYIYNSLGKMIKNIPEMPQDKTINIADLSNGVYIVKIIHKSSNNYAIQKLIVYR